MFYTVRRPDHHGLFLWGYLKRQKLLVLPEVVLKIKARLYEAIASDSEEATEKVSKNLKSRLLFKVLQNGSDSLYFLNSLKRSIRSSEMRPEASQLRLSALRQSVSNRAWIQHHVHDEHDEQYPSCACTECGVNRKATRASKERERSDWAEKSARMKNLGSTSLEPKQVAIDPSVGDFAAFEICNSTSEALSGHPIQGEGWGNTCFAVIGGEDVCVTGDVCKVCYQHIRTR